MLLVNFTLQVVAISEEDDRRKKAIVTLCFDRDYKGQDCETDDSQIPIKIHQSQGFVTNMDTAPGMVLEAGSPDHDLLRGVADFLQRWCEKNNPFAER